VNVSHSPSATPAAERRRIGQQRHPHAQKRHHKSPDSKPRHTPGTTITAMPPTNVGTTLAANVTAASSADRVRSYTSTVSATRASWSPLADNI